MERHATEDGTPYWRFAETLSREPHGFGSTAVSLAIAELTGLRAADPLRGEPYDFLAVETSPGTVDVFAGVEEQEAIYGALWPAHFSVMPLSFDDPESADPDYYGFEWPEDRRFLRVRA